MSSERRYSQEEISLIFKKASEDQEIAEQATSEGAGLTLAELKEIGGDIGVSTDLIERAARSMEVPDVPFVPARPRETFLGVPISASYEIELPGSLSDDNWHRLVVEMRETFRAQGQIEINGQFRSWRNGNLRISVEPTDTGHLFRMSTYKGGAQYTIIGSLIGAMIAAGILIFGTFFQPGKSTSQA